jgi:hypothetical protein
MGTLTTSVAEPKLTLQSSAFSSQGVVKPVLTAEQARVASEEFLKLCETVLTEDDYVYYIHYRQPSGQEERVKTPFTKPAYAEEARRKLKRENFLDVEIVPRKKRSAFDRLAKEYNLTVPQEHDEAQLVTINVQNVGEYIVEQRVGKSFAMVLYQKIANLEIVKAHCLIAVAAPNGRVAIGDAACSTAERKRGVEGFYHADHDVPTTAFTRAYNRAVSRCIGMGELSAEEIAMEENPAQPPSVTPPAAPSPFAGSQAATETSPPSDKATSSPGQEAPADDNRYQPPPEGTKLDTRIRLLEAYLFGETNLAQRGATRGEQVVKYLFFFVPTLVNAKIEKRPGFLDPTMWRKAMEGLEDRKTRMSVIEQFAATLDKATFLDKTLTILKETLGAVA